MKRSELEHIIRAAGAIVGENEIVVIGSQSILGQFPAAVSDLLISEEADIFPKKNIQAAELIDGSIGELSPFHATFGYYAHGVSPETSCLPNGWEERLVKVSNDNTGGCIGWCLEVHDLAISKYVSGREKDLAFTRILAREQYTEKDVLCERVANTELADERRKLVTGLIERDFRS